METIRQLLEQSPMLALFAVIGLGYAIGQISILGFSLGVGAVLFAGLAVGSTWTAKPRRGVRTVLKRLEALSLNE